MVEILVKLHNFTEKEKEYIHIHVYIYCGAGRVVMPTHAILNSLGGGGIYIGCSRYVRVCHKHNIWNLMATTGKPVIWNEYRGASDLNPKVAAPVVPRLADSRLRSSTNLVATKTTHNKNNKSVSTHLHNTHHKSSIY